MTALPGYGSSNGLELDGMTTMKIVDGAPNASQLVLQALDLVEDDWCLGSFMNLEAGSSAQVVLGSPAICGMVWKELGDNIIIVATLLSLRTHDDDDIQLQYDIKHPLVLTRYYDCRLYNQISKLSGKEKMINQYYMQSLASFSLSFFFLDPSFYCMGIDTVSLSDDIHKVTLTYIRITVMEYCFLVDFIFKQNGDIKRSMVQNDKSKKNNR
ncbi:uncharacterized protein BX664DRAFT_361293 [Halteromyces radiatus]|uniref:uncharacterized protein n=1 Tax=Halteromyces radiatus TaxID=101107 RepID=UPI00221E458E|nr:uncharacterized protein BX664DRAFT_361293 [Halteromyces radiatus]KAI8083019.1 hypothetical protein BX664DRAFT_361293 [Halteromyces radiatus]